MTSEQNQPKPKLIIFASGGAEGGGSGFEKLVLASRSHAENGSDPLLQADIVAVVSNHENGGVCEKAHRLGIPFIHFPAPYTADEYNRIVALVGAEFVALSGWIKIARGLDPRVTFNIHPGPLPRFGGKGMFSHYLHDAVMEAYKRGEVTESEINMHFVTDEYDKGPTFFKLKIPILPDDTAETLFKRANAAEHKWQPIITNKILNGEIGWDGKDPESLTGQIIG